VPIDPTKKQSLLDAVVAPHQAEMALMDASSGIEDGTLQADQNLIGKIVGDVDLAARTVGCIAQTKTTIAGL